MGDQPVGPGRDQGPAGKCGTVWGTLREVRDGSGDPRLFPERVGGSIERSGTGRLTLWVVRNEMGDSR